MSCCGLGVLRLQASVIPSGSWTTQSPISDPHGFHGLRRRAEGRTPQAIRLSVCGQELECMRKRAMLTADMPALFASSGLCCTWQSFTVGNVIVPRRAHGHNASILCVLFTVLAPHGLPLHRFRPQLCFLHLAASIYHLVLSASVWSTATIDLPGE